MAGGWKGDWLVTVVGGGKGWGDWMAVGGHITELISVLLSSRTHCLATAVTRLASSSSCNKFTVVQE